MAQANDVQQAPRINVYQAYTVPFKQFPNVLLQYGNHFALACTICGGNARGDNPNAFFDASGTAFFQHINKIHGGLAGVNSGKDFLGNLPHRVLTAVEVQTIRNGDGAQVIARRPMADRHGVQAGTVAEVSLIPNFPTVVQKPDGSKVDLECVFCRGNAKPIRGRNNDKNAPLEFLVGVRGMQGHISQIHAPSKTISIDWVLNTCGIPISNAMFNRLKQNTAADMIDMVEVERTSGASSGQEACEFSRPWGCTEAYEAEPWYGDTSVIAKCREILLTYRTDHATPTTDTSPPKRRGIGSHLGIPGLKIRNDDHATSTPHASPFGQLRSSSGGPIPQLKIQNHAAASSMTDASPYDDSCFGSRLAIPELDFQHGPAEMWWPKPPVSPLALSLPRSYWPVPPQMARPRFAEIASEYPGLRRTRNGPLHSLSPGEMDLIGTPVAVNWRNADGTPEPFTLLPAGYVDAVRHSETEKKSGLVWSKTM